MGRPAGPEQKTDGAKGHEFENVGSIAPESYAERFCFYWRAAEAIRYHARSDPADVEEVPGKLFYCGEDLRRARTWAPPACLS